MLPNIAGRIKFRSHIVNTVVIITVSLIFMIDNNQTAILPLTMTSNIKNIGSIETTKYMEVIKGIVSKNVVLAPKY